MRQSKYRHPMNRYWDGGACRRKSDLGEALTDGVERLNPVVDTDRRILRMDDPKYHGHTDGGLWASQRRTVSVNAGSCEPATALVDAIFPRESHAPSR